MATVPARGDVANAGIWAGERRLLTLGLVLTVVGVAFEALAVAATLPATVRDIGGLELYGWTFSAFMLANLIGATLAGSIADRRGPALPFAAGAGLFVVGLLAAGLAPSMPVLVGARVVQGLGGGMISAVSYVAVGRGYPEQAKPQMLAVLSTAWVVPGLVGPGLAGLVAEGVGWRWVFLGLAPLAPVAAAMALPALRRMGPPTGAADAASADARAAARRSVVAAVQLAAGAGLVMGGLGLALTSPAPALGLVAGGGALAAAALRRLMPEGTLTAARGTPSAIVAMLLLNLSFFGVDAFVPLALIELRGLSAAVAGLALTAATITWTAGSWVQARLAARVARSVVTAAGLALVALGVAGVAASLGPPAPVWAATAAWAVAGLGIGLAYSALSLVALERAQPGQEGRNSAAIQIASQLGTALGAGVGGVIVGSGAEGVSAARVAAQCALMAAVAGLGALAARRV